jgi:hypothetical protein
VNCDFPQEFMLLQQGLWVAAGHCMAGRKICWKLSRDVTHLRLSRTDAVLSILFFVTICKL